MNMPNTGIWPKTLNLLKNELTEISYNTWIKTIEPLDINANTIQLGVPTDFNKGILESRYSFLIKNALREVTSKDFNVNIVVPSDVMKMVNQSKPESAVRDNMSFSLLNPKYTFDTFVIGNSNRLAHAAAVAVSETPAKAYNPLFLYGGVGLGKTHLMHAIGHHILKQNPATKVLYVSSEKFTNELINAIKDDKNKEFRNKYRSIDVLLIDDIQFIGGKERTQEEFFHTFNELYEADKQIIISSDRSPKDIVTLEDRLRSRFEWGLSADVQSPDFETRIAILKKKAQIENMYIPNEAYSFIAEKVVSNIRELEGAMNRVLAYSSLTESDITVPLCEEALKELIIAGNSKIINSNLIVDTVARYFDIRAEEFKTNKRNREISYPRQIAMFLCRKMTDLSLPKIGFEFGGRDHTTVMHAIEKITNQIQADSETRRTIEELTRTISGK